MPADIMADIKKCRLCFLETIAIEIRRQRKSKSLGDRSKKW
jgi:hypothetical protein